MCVSTACAILCLYKSHLFCFSFALVHADRRAAFQVFCVSLFNGRDCSAVVHFTVRENTIKFHTNTHTHTCASCRQCVCVYASLTELIHTASLLRYIYHLFLFSEHFFKDGRINIDKIKVACRLWTIDFTDCKTKRKQFPFRFLRKRKSFNRIEPIERQIQSDSVCVQK